jgi:hypothetical protein
VSDDRIPYPGQPDIAANLPRQSLPIGDELIETNPIAPGRARLVFQQAGDIDRGFVT